MLLSAAAPSAPADQPIGWAGPVALIVACGIFWVFVLVHRKITNPSPPPPARPGTKALERGHGRDTASDLRPDTRRPELGTTRDTKFPGRDTTSPGPDTNADTSWYGRIVEVGGRRFRTAAHIARTGDSPPPEPERDDFDDALDLAADDGPATAEEWLIQAHDKRVRYGVMVQVLVDDFGRSERSAKRDIADWRDRNGWARPDEQ